VTALDPAVVEFLTAGWLQAVRAVLVVLVAIIGLRLARPHTNSRGLIHGGLIAALSDNAMGYSCAHRMGGVSSLVTVGLAVDFVGTAQIGQWLAIETEVIKTGSTICFAQSLVKADDVVIARANATFRVVPKKEPVA